MKGLTHRLKVTQTFQTQRIGARKMQQQRTEETIHEIQQTASP